MRNEVSVKVLLEGLVQGILESGSALVLDGSFYHQLENNVEHQTLHAKSPEELATEYAGQKKLLDFGCGTGGHRDLLERLGYDWNGLNYKDGMATEAARIATEMDDSKIFFYDGARIPFESEAFDIVYSFQTFEHIQNIEVTFKEICRILKPGGRLIGAVSYLEQIHDFSTFNFTPYGFKYAVEKAGMRLHLVYPRADAFSFLLRRLLVVTSASDDNSITHSAHAGNFINTLLANYAMRHADVKEANLLRLMFATHFTFDVAKAAESENAA
jgi:SAM-dependent methyltransferase